MLRFLLTPRWLLIHAGAVVGIIGCVLLGQWQWNTYESSQNQQETRELPAEPISALVEPGGPLADAADRPVVATGTYVQALVVPGRIHDGILGDFAAGMLRTDDGLLLVLRGWSPTVDGIRAPGGVVDVEGHLMPAETSGHATDPNAPAVDGDTITYLDPELARQAVPDATGEPLYPGYLLVTEEQGASAADAGLTRMPVDQFAPVHDVSPWQNLSYWAQWWVFAAAVVLFWASFVRSGIRARRAEQQGITPPEKAPAPSA